MTETNHPKALPYLFLTEMWERFGFYVVQGLLVLYMSKAFGFTDEKSYTIMGVFSALAYISPFVGGSLADRILGFKVSILIGGVLLSIGYAMLATGWGNIFYLSLATIVVGNGLFKPNISTLLGLLYAPDNPQRDSGFTIFYMGINIGVLLSGFSSGYIKDHFGWDKGFALASIGLLIGLVTFLFGLKTIDEIPKPARKSDKISTLTKFLIFIACLIAIYLVSLLIQSTLLAKWLLPTAGCILLGYLFYLSFQQEPNARKNMLVLIALILSSIVYWMFLLQLFMSANLFVERMVDRNIFGINIPTTIFYTFESIFIILLGPLFAWSWHTLNEAEKNPPAIVKFILAIFFGGCCFLILSISTHFANANNLVNPLWIVVAYLSLTIGELLLSPIGLSAVTSLAPRHLVGMMMGVWFVGTGFGGQFAGFLAQLSNVPASVTDPVTILQIYRTAFMDFAYIGFGVAAALFIMRLILKRILQHRIAEV